MSKKDGEDEESNAEPVGITVPSTQLEEWEEQIEEEGWSSRSRYIREHAEAGRKELAKLHPADSPRDNSIEQEVLDNIPEQIDVEAEGDTEAPGRDELIEAVLNPIRRQILEEIDALQSADLIEHSAVHGGYVKK